MSARSLFTIRLKKPHLTAIEKMMKRYLFLTAAMLLTIGCDNEKNPLITASDCYNNQLSQVGTRVITEFTIHNNGVLQNNLYENKKVESTTTFEGVSGVSEINSFDQAGVVVGSTAFIKYDDTQKNLLALGSIENSVTTVLKPSGILRQMNISVGDKQYVPTVTFVKAGIEISTLEMSYTFLGNETVTVPAGTFNTCKFEIVTSDTVNGLTSSKVTIQNIGMGNAMTIKETSTITQANNSKIILLQELVSATINGTAI